MEPRRVKDAGEEVVEALGELAVPAYLRSDLLVEACGRSFVVEVKNRVSAGDALAVAAQLHEYARRFGAGGAVVVADRISSEARRELTDAGIAWLDRRGHLSIRSEGLIVDADVPTVLPVVSERVVELFSPVGLDVAIALLLQPDERTGTMELSRRTKRSPGRVSEILSAMRERGLVDGDGRPLIPELFEELAEEWSPRWYGLSSVPPFDSSYRLSGTLGALWHGAPLVATSKWPPDLYVADRWAVRRLLTSMAATGDEQAAARVAVCPSTYGFQTEAGKRGGYPVASHLIVALDLAQDRARGREVLASWNPEGHVRVW
ncbi:MAG: hypothetical protein M0035_13810 [Actinomycetota bacterium]|jgi:hypothetical protein|nr:hypothetical protein [Actinomycetota bacterium]